MRRMWICVVLTTAIARGELMPIFMMHGVGGTYHDFDGMTGWITEVDPAVVIENLQLYNGPMSLENMWTQQQAIVDAIREKVRAKPEVYRHGYVFLCHSQGAVLCRSVIEMMDDHHVHSFISLAGPHMGEFGIPGIFQDVIPWGRDLAWRFFFTDDFQSKLSVAAYWNDPRHDEHLEYLANNTFLPVFNNEPNRSSQGPGLPKSDAEADRYKNNFLRLEKLVLLMGGRDETIIPKESSHFEFYNEEMSAVVPLEDTPLWLQDHLGLRALNSTGRLVRLVNPTARHLTWMHNKTVCQQFILPWLPSLPTSLLGPSVVYA